MVILIGQCDECGRVVDLTQKPMFDTENGTLCLSCYEEEEPRKLSEKEHQNIVTTFAEKLKDVILYIHELEDSGRYEQG